MQVDTKMSEMIGLLKGRFGNYYSQIEPYVLELEKLHETLKIDLTYSKGTILYSAYIEYSKRIEIVSKEDKLSEIRFVDGAKVDIFHFVRDFVRGPNPLVIEFFRDYSKLFAQQYSKILERAKESFSGIGEDDKTVMLYLIKSDLDMLRAEVSILKDAVFKLTFKDSMNN